MGFWLRNLRKSWVMVLGKTLFLKFDFPGLNKKDIFLKQNKNRRE